MEKTENLNLNILGDDDFVDVQVLNDNTRKIDEAIQEIKDTEEITVEELREWYNGDTGIQNSEIDEMYAEDIVYDEDSGISNSDIDEMYKF